MLWGLLPALPVHAVAQESGHVSWRLLLALLVELQVSAVAQESGHVCWGLLLALLVELLLSAVAQESGHVCWRFLPALPAHAVAQESGHVSWRLLLALLVELQVSAVAQESGHVSRRFLLALLLSAVAQESGHVGWGLLLALLLELLLSAVAPESGHVFWRLLPALLAELLEPAGAEPGGTMLQWHRCAVDLLLLLCWHMQSLNAAAETSGHGPWPMGLLATLLPALTAHRVSSCGTAQVSAVAHAVAHALLGQESGLVIGGLQPGLLLELAGLFVPAQGLLQVLQGLAAALRLPGGCGASSSGMVLFRQACLPWLLEAFPSPGCPGFLGFGVRCGRSGCSHPHMSPWYLDPQNHPPALLPACSQSMILPPGLPAWHVKRKKP